MFLPHRFASHLFVLLCVGLTSIAIAHAADRRVALVIGNAAYPAAPLNNPVNDARAIAAKLKAIGFEVIQRENLTSKQIGGALREFRSRLAPGAEALFFYAGHGLQVKGVNYLPAVDADIAAEEDVPTQSIDVNKVLETMEDSRTRLNLVFLDACRNNPFTRRFRSAGEGLAKVNAPSGTIMSFATRPGSVAADGEGVNGLYTEHLLKAMDASGLPIEQALKRVYSGVKLASKGRQEPWTEGGIEGDFYFVPSNAPAGQAPQQIAQLTPTVTSARTPQQIEDELWDNIKDSDKTAVFEEYLRQYPRGRYIAQAKVLLAALKGAPTAGPAVAESPEAALWKAVEASNSKDDYQAYLSQYPKGKYAALVPGRIKKLEADASLKAAAAKQEEAELHPGKLFRDCPECPEMVVIPSGSFAMGSDTSYGGKEAPVHTVNIAKPFAVGRTEITMGEWRAVMGSYPASPRCGDSCPAEGVTWYKAKEFVRRLSQKTGKPYRLPSEAEWEYACRADGAETECRSDRKYTPAWADSHPLKFGPVGNSRPNTWGLHDMTSNAWEWVEDCWHDNYLGAPTDGTAWLTGCRQDGDSGTRRGSFTWALGGFEGGIYVGFRELGGKSFSGLGNGLRVVRDLR